MPELEHIPADEAANIAKIAALTIRQLDRRYPAPEPILRGVHAKDHGCVRATFKIDACLPEDLRVGVLAGAGREYEASSHHRLGAKAPGGCPMSGLA